MKKGEGKLEKGELKMSWGEREMERKGEGVIKHITP